MAGNVLLVVVVMVVCMIQYCSSSASPRPELVSRTCGNIRERKTSVEYIMAMYNQMVSEMSENMGRNKYSVAEEGKPPDRLFLFAQCMTDVSTKECIRCFNLSAQALASCLPQHEGGRVVYDGCFIRADDYHFFQEIMDDLGNNVPQPVKVKASIIRHASYILSLCFVAFLFVVGYCVGKTTYSRISHCFRCKSLGMEKESSALNQGSQHLHFKYSTIMKATECFDESHKLGHGAYGEVFKGILPDGREMAIKRLFLSGKDKSEQVYNEIDIISRAQHKNLVRFLGCCFTNTDCFLIYEFLANKSLDLILFDREKKKELDWKKRLGIIIGTAEGLEYLQKDCQVRIIHRDIKASNILLDLKHKPKIADFGLARFYSSDKNIFSTAIAGTIGYIAPEYLTHGRLTEKVDVYSFGVLLLEIVSGVQNNKFEPQDPLETLVTSVWQHFQNNTVSEIIDQSMENIEDCVEEITRVVHVGLLCTQASPDLRPTMTFVIQMLKQKDFELPEPTKPPFIDIAQMEMSPSLGSSPLRPPHESDLCTRHYNFQY